MNVSVSGGSISASISGQSVVAASVSGSGQVSVSHQPSQQVAATVTGGVGPRGQDGVGIGDLDIALVGLADGDLLRYSQNKWRNYHESGLVDGGNW